VYEWCVYIPAEREGDALTSISHGFRFASMMFVCVRERERERDRQTDV
jgi:hypothetical protein